MSKTIRFIGDVHGKFRRYREIIRDCPCSIQVGDMGVGFRSFPHGEESANPPYNAMREGDHRFIRGNHDNPCVCKNHSQWLSDGHVEDGMMFIGGADSIDKAYRIEGYSWWRDEELSYAQLDELVQKYQQVKPEIIVTHDCPQDVAAEIIRPMLLNGSFEQTRTRKAFQEMWSCHSPKIWIHGHYHVSRDTVLNGTRFICLAELEYKDIEI